MKRMLCMILTLVMALSLAVPAFAAQTSTDGNPAALDTAVTYLPGDTNGNGEIDDNEVAGDTDGDGDADIVETYTVVVPANVAVGGTGTVAVEGKWASNRQVTVVPATTVTLTCGADSKTLTVSMDKTAFVGSNTAAIDTTATVSVEGWADTTKNNVAEPLFGTWTGTFNYTVGISDVA